jgi:hypothetical protein
MPLMPVRQTATREQLTKVVTELAKAMMNYGKTLDDLKQRIEALEAKANAGS